MARRAAAVLLVLIYASWAVSLPPFSAAATAAVVVAGAAAMVSGAVTPRPRRPPVDLPRAGVWGALAALAVLWQLAAYLQEPREDHPTISSLANALLDSQPTRAIAFVLWILAARELSRR